MAHPLDGAFLRVQRAEHHLAEFLSKEAEFLESERKHTFIDIDSPVGNNLINLTLGYPESEPPLFFGVLIGEVIYNLRAGLDYLVYALAEHDSGTAQDDTQFVIVDGPADFRKQKWRMKGLTDAHIAAIERLQPYSGCHWTGAIRRLSNPDKHRHLTKTRSQFTGVGIRFLSGPVEPGDEMPAGTIHRTRDPSTGEEMEVHFHLTAFIGFADQTPVVDTLRRLKIYVGETLQAFKPEF